MLRTVSKFKEYVKAEYQNWTRAMVVMTHEERQAFRGLFKAVLSESDGMNSSLNEFSSDAMFMLMLIHLKAEVDKLEEKLDKSEPGAQPHRFQAPGRPSRASGS